MVKSMHFSALIICMVAWNVYVNVYIFEFVYRYVCILNIQVRKSYRNIQVLTGNNEQMYAVLIVLVILRKRILWCERSNRITINSPNLQVKGFVPVWSFACVFRQCISVNFSRHLYPHTNTQILCTLSTLHKIFSFLVLSVSVIILWLFH